MTGRRALLAGGSGVLLLTALLLILFRFMENSGEFDLREVGVYGCRTEDSASVSRCMQPYLGLPVTGLSESEIEESLSAVPGIDSAEVWFELPDRACVIVELAVPVLVLCDGGSETALTAGCEPLPASFRSDTLTRVVTAGGGYLGVLPGLAEWAASGGIPREVDSILVEPSGAVAVSSDGMRIVLGYTDFDGRLETFLSSGGRSALRGGWVEADARFDGQLILRETPTGPGGVSI
jgi:hypothetical protein